MLFRSGCASSRHGGVVKVLPQYLDANGQHTVSPSLYDRDAYQADLRLHPEKRSGIRYVVQWRAVESVVTMKLRVELRGIAHGTLPGKKTIETEIKGGRGASRWENVKFSGEEYKSFGEITAWRVTLWDGDKLLGEQKSFLW